MVTPDCGNNKRLSRSVEIIQQESQYMHSEEEQQEELFINRRKEVGFKPLGLHT